MKILSECIPSQVVAESKRKMLPPSTPYCLPLFTCDKPILPRKKQLNKILTRAKKKTRFLETSLPARIHQPVVKRGSDIWRELWEAKSWVTEFAFFGSFFNGEMWYSYLTHNTYWFMRFFFVFREFKFSVVSLISYKCNAKFVSTT